MLKLNEIAQYAGFVDMYNYLRDTHKFSMQFAMEYCYTLYSINHRYYNDKWGVWCCETLK